MRRAIAPAAVVVVAFFAVAAVSGFRTKLVLGVFTSMWVPIIRFTSDRRCGAPASKSIGQDPRAERRIDEESAA
jgi:hypothetical protein